MLKSLLLEETEEVTKELPEKKHQNEMVSQGISKKSEKTIWFQCSKSPKRFQQGGKTLKFFIVKQV